MTPPTGIPTPGSPARRLARGIAGGTILLAAALALPPRAGGQVPADTGTARDTSGGVRDARPARDTGSVRDTVARLAPIEVTADRFPGAAARAPWAVDVRTGDRIPRGTPALALDEALRGLPGIQVDNRFNYALGERISIRGAGARAQFGVRGVRVLIDGIPATLPDGQTTLNQVDLATIAGLEVVRGPVASMFGNAAGGAILVETAPPPASPLEAAATVTSGSHGLLRTGASVGGSRGAFGYTVRGSRVGYGGYRAHSDADNRYAAARLQWVGDRDFVRAILDVVDYDALNPGSLSDSLLRVDRRAAFGNNVAQRTGEAGSQQRGGLQWRRALGDDALEVTGWAIGRDLRNPIPARIVSIDRLVTGVRAIHRGARGPLAWTAGVEREVQRDGRLNHVNDGGADGALVLDQDERVGSLGTFLQATVAAGSRVHLAGGIRHDRTTFAATDHLVSDTDPDDSGSRTLHAWSPSAGLTLEVADGTLAYANVGTAFETPTTTELANRASGAGGFNPDLDPQRTVSWEVGARRGSGAATMQLALYRALVRDALIPFEVPEVAGRQFFRNAGRTEARGIEAGLSLRPAARLDASIAYTYTDARFREYVVGGTSYAGGRVPGVAPHRLELATTWRAGGSWIGADLRHKARMVVDDANTASAPAYTVADLRLGTEKIRAGATRMSLFGGIQNLAGAAYDASVVVNAFGRRYHEPGPGRTFHLGASVTAR